MLGRLLVELRQEVVSGARTATTSVEPLPIGNFLMLEKAIPLL